MEALLERGTDVENWNETQFGRINDRLDKLTFAIIGILGTFAAASFATILGSALS
jgi:hypothetical protein